MGPIDPAFVVSNQGSTTPALVVRGVNGNGTVGIGTSTPWWNLQIAAAGSSTLAMSDMNAAVGNKHWLFDVNGGNLYIDNPSDTFATTTTANGGAKVKLLSSGELVLGTAATGTGAGFKLSVINTGVNANIVRFQDSSNSCDGNPGGTMAFTCSSDQRLKHGIVDTNWNIDDLNQFRIRNFVMNSDTSSTTLTGVIAQEVLTHHPGMVSVDPVTGFYAVTEVSSWQLLKSIEDLGAIIGIYATSSQLQASTTAMSTETPVDVASQFAAAIASGARTLTNFIAARITAVRVYATEIFSDKSHQKQLCVGDTGNETCLNKTQIDSLLQVLNNGGSSGGSTSGGGSSGTSTGSGLGEASSTQSAPVLELFGNASSTVSMGSAYNDLGAQIVSPAADMNLGIDTFVDGATSSPVVIDTSATGTHSILYRVTDSYGQTGSVSRTITVTQ